MWAPNVGSEGSITAVRKRMASRRPQANARVRSGRALVGVLGGSKSDFPVLEKAVAMLTQLGIPNELLVVSAHRTPDRLFAYAERAPSRGSRSLLPGRAVRRICRACWRRRPICPSLVCRFPLNT